jgi:hypothetical protein
MTVRKPELRMLAGKALRDAQALAALIVANRIGAPELDLEADVYQIIDRLSALASDLERVLPDEGGELDHIEMCVGLRAVPLGDQEDEDISLGAFIATRDGDTEETDELHYRVESLAFVIGADETPVEVPKDTEQLIAFGKQLVWMSFKDMLDQIPAAASIVGYGDGDGKDDPDDAGFDLSYEEIRPKRPGDRSFSVSVSPQIAEFFGLDPESDAVDLTVGTADMMLSVQHVQPGLGRVIGAVAADADDAVYQRFQRTRDPVRAAVDLLRVFKRLKAGMAAAPKKPTIN